MLPELQVFEAYHSSRKMFAMFFWITAIDIVGIFSESILLVVFV